MTASIVETANKTKKRPSRPHQKRNNFKISKTITYGKVSMGKKFKRSNDKTANDEVFFVVQSLSLYYLKNVFLI